MLKVVNRCLIRSACFRVSLFIIVILSFSVAQAQVRQPNILWITCEDISPYIGAYGDKLVQTPNIDQLAKEGIRYTNVFTTAGVCAPSRSSIITGMYQTSIGTQHMRTLGVDPKYMPPGVPSYSAVIPGYVKCFPEYLRQAGYYCTNNEKQDYQFEAPVTVWDENGPAASFRNRPADKPFFSIFNLFITHESQIFSRTDSLLVNGDNVNVPPYYPDTKVVRHDMARLFTNIERMDSQVGELIRMLKKDGLYDKTIIFFYSDHGGALPWMKREVLERGTHIPFVIRFPNAKDGGTINEDMISAVDFAPTVLSLAGIKIPSYMQGQAFLGGQKAKAPRRYVYAARDRMDELYDRVRMVRDKQFRYLYNYMPGKPYYQNLVYRLNIPMMREMLQLKEEGKLNTTQMAWFQTKPIEELYDVKNDPDELHNLAADPAYKTKLVELRTVFQNWTHQVGDMSATSEKDMIKKWWNGKDEPPVTEVPQLIKTAGGIKISCKTTGASIGYRIIKKDAPEQPAMHTVQSWDYGLVFGRAINGNIQLADPVWQVYQGEAIPLQTGDTLRVNAMRIGYKPSELMYVGGQSIRVAVSK